MLPESVQSFVALSPIQRGPIAAAVAMLASELPAGSRVLDAGAGDAPYAALFEHCEHVTQDWSGSVHDGARRADIVADLHDLPVEDSSFDAVVCTEVLEHVEEPSRVLDEIHRVMRPGAPLLITVPFVVELHEEPHDYARYTSHGLRGLLRRGGFEVLSVEPSTGWFATFAQVLRHQAASVTPLDQRATLAARMTGTMMLGLSEILRRLAPRFDDRLDRRRALPLGWIARAERPRRAV